METPKRQEAAMADAVDLKFPNQGPGSGERMFNQKFCTPQNLKNSMSYINHALVSFGFDSNGLNVFQADAEEASRIVNCILTLLQAYQKNKDYQENMDARLNRLISDNESQSANIDRLKQKLELSERESDSLKSKLALVTENNLELCKENSSLKEGLKVTKANLQYAKNQLNHEIRKKDKEFSKIQQNIVKLMSSAAKSERQPTISVLNPAKTHHYGVRSPSEELDMQQEILQDFEIREKELVEENQKLREELFLSLKAIKGFIKTKFSPLASEIAEIDAEFILNKDGVEKAQFFLPHVQTQNLCEKVKEALESLDSRLDEWREQLLSTVDRSKERTQELDALRRQINDYKKVVEKQAKLIELSLSSQAQPTHDTEHEIRLQKLEKELTKEKERIKADRELLEKERKSFMEAAVKLGKQRALFEQEQEEFAQEKMSAETKNVLQALPSTPAWLKNSYAQIMAEKSAGTPLNKKPQPETKPSNGFDTKAIDALLKTGPKENQENANANLTDTATGKPMASTPGAIPAYLMKKSKHSPFDPQVSSIGNRTVEKTSPAVNNSWTPTPGLGRQILQEKQGSKGAQKVSFQE